MKLLQIIEVMCLLLARVIRKRRNKLRAQKVKIQKHKEDGFALTFSEEEFVELTGHHPEANRLYCDALKKGVSGPDLAIVFGNISGQEGMSTETTITSLLSYLFVAEKRNTPLRNLLFPHILSLRHPVATFE